MNSETRVGIDGRRYARKQPKQYIDVLHMPSIADAVNQASKMLRAGIIHAMSCNPEDPRDAAEPRPKAKSDRIVKPVPVTRGRAKPHDVYSALAEKSNKLTKEKAAALREVKEVTAAVVSNESSLHELSPSKADGASGSKVVARSWNSSSKAGPSILSKRPRSIDSGSDSSSGSSDSAVIDPVQKRERRQKDGDSCEAGSGRLMSMESASEQKKTGTSAVWKDKQILDPRRNSEARRNVKKLGCISEGKGSVKRALGPGKLIRKAEHVRTTKVPTMANKAASLANRASILANRMSKTSTKDGSPMRPTATIIASGMVPSLPTTVKPTGKTMTVIASGTKSNGMSAIANRITNASLRNASIPAVPKFVPRSIGAVSAYRNVTPETLHIKELNRIGNIPANGYQKMSSGKLRPVVTFDPRPKVPHKLRQRTIEKIFEAWRDMQQLPEMEALVKALRTEQQMYASAAGHMDYRAAATDTLKMARK